MSHSKMLEVVTPVYLERFSCLGPSCPDDCCHGLDVTVDHDIYSRLQGLPDRALKPVIMHALHRGQGKSGSASYGYLSRQQGERGNCEFLSAERLCRLQQKCGEQMLPDVCSAFPRVTKMVAGQAEQYATLACPEIVRLLLASEDALQLQLRPVSVRVGTIEQEAPAMASPAAHQVREFFLTLLATAELPAWQSLAVMLLLAEALQPLFGEHGADEAQVARLLADWEQQLLDGRLLSELDALRRHDLLHVKVMAAASRVRADIDFRSPRYLQLIEEALHGLAADSADAAALAHGFAAMDGMAAMDARLRRVLFNHAAMRYFPSVGNLLADVEMLCIQYLSLRFWLAGLAQARGGNLPQEAEAELIYLFYRVNIHVPSYLQQCYQALQQAGMTKVEHWLLLLPLLGGQE